MIYIVNEQFLFCPVVNQSCMMICGWQIKPEWMNGHKMPMGLVLGFFNLVVGPWLVNMHHYASIGSIRRLE